MKTAIDVLGWVSALAALASGVCWIKAAWVETPLPMAYLSGPPKNVTDNVRHQSWWNGIAAWFAAGAALAQSAALTLPKLLG
jgi:hypothetical protein